MKSFARVAVIITIVGMLGLSSLTAAPTIQVPSGIDVEPWSALLRKYVDENGLVAYEKWKNEPNDIKALDSFIERNAAAPTQPAQGPEEIAALINAYNALTIRWILRHYPTESIRALDNSFGGARWNIGGRVISLDEIEHKNLRPLYGWRVHATIVCAARSCPPLLREGFSANNLNALTEKAYRAWMGREDLNRFHAEGKRAELSPIFKWFKDDFTGDGEIAKVLARYAPEKYRSFLERRNFKIEYLKYNWGLNDQSERGANYRASLRDRLFGDAK